MAKNVDVRLKLTGLNKVMRSPEVQAVVNEKAYRLASAAGPGHRAVVSPHKWVARAFVEQEDAAQAKKDPNGLSLLRALGHVTD